MTFGAGFVMLEQVLGPVKENSNSTAKKDILDNFEIFKYTLFLPYHIMQLYRVGWHCVQQSRHHDLSHTFISSNGPFIEINFLSSS